MAIGLSAKPASCPFRTPRAGWKYCVIWLGSVHTIIYEPLQPLGVLTLELYQVNNTGYWNTITFSGGEGLNRIANAKCNASVMRELYRGTVGSNIGRTSTGPLKQCTEYHRFVIALAMIVHAILPIWSIYCQGI